MTGKTKALFLDRDGVICRALGKYLTSWDEFELLQDIQDLLDVAHKEGYLVIVVTNQPQIAKGLLTEKQLAVIHAKMEELLNHTIDKVYYCPHQNEDNCECRKPKPGMLMKASCELDIDLTRSLIVGDHAKDMSAGKIAGCKTVFLKNEYNTQDLSVCSPDIIIEDLEEILDSIRYGLLPA